MNRHEALKLLGQIRRLAREQVDFHGLPETQRVPVLELALSIPPELETEEGIEFLLGRVSQLNSKYEAEGQGLEP